MPQAPRHKPSLVEWTSFLLSLLFLIGVFYISNAYQSYRDITAAARLPAAKRLELLQRTTLPVTSWSIKTWMHQQPTTPDIENYRTGFSNDTFKRPPFVVLCRDECVRDARSVTMALAYGLHYSRSFSADNWDFWFAPIHGEDWIRDSTRLLYRINPSQSDHWGLIDGSWTDLNVDFSENKIAGVSNLGTTSLADYLHEIVENQDVEAANVIGAPSDSLTVHGSFGEGPILDSPPGWRSIGTWVDDVRTDLPTFISEASSGKTLAQWLGDHIFDLLWLLGVGVVGFFYVIKGWRAVVIYGYFWFLDELEKERLEAK